MALCVETSQHFHIRSWITIAVISCIASTTHSQSGTRITGDIWNDDDSLPATNGWKMVDKNNHNMNPYPLTYGDNSLIYRGPFSGPNGPYKITQQFHCIHQSLISVFFNVYFCATEWTDIISLYLNDQSDPIVNQGLDTGSTTTAPSYYDQSLQQRTACNNYYYYELGPYNISSVDANVDFKVQFQIDVNSNNEYILLRNIVIRCKEIITTTSPTLSPIRFPTNTPSDSPSNNPTRSPSNSPTNIPISKLPSFSPTITTMDPFEFSSTMQFTTNVPLTPSDVMPSYHPSQLPTSKHIFVPPEPSNSPTILTQLPETDHSKVSGISHSNIVIIVVIVSVLIAVFLFICGICIWRKRVSNRLKYNKDFKQHLLMETTGNILHNEHNSEQNNTKQNIKRNDHDIVHSINKWDETSTGGFTSTIRDDNITSGGDIELLDCTQNDSNKQHKNELCEPDKYDGQNEQNEIGYDQNNNAEIIHEREEGKTESNEKKNAESVELEYGNHRLLNRDYIEWNSDDIIEWICCIESDRYKKYKSKISITIKQENITGEYLMDTDKSDLHRFGITDFGDKKRILNHIKNLHIKNNNNDNDHIVEGVDATI